MDDLKPILILGAGINGAALARELLLNQVPVVVVDQDDLSSGATAYSSRLIHGGLRYLEYSEFDLVRESLAERTRLLRLAPHHVRPLRLFVPVVNRFGGLIASARRFLRIEGRKSSIQEPSRGLWLVRLGLQFYDAYARDPTLPRHDVHRLAETGVPRVNDERYIRMCSYYDAQVRFPERFVVSLFADAQRIAKEKGIRFSLYTYHRAQRSGRHVEIAPLHGGDGESSHALEPSAIVNATGAWVDSTLRELEVESPRLMGGTQGSHLVTHKPALRDALEGQALYAEAKDGRPIFILPLGPATLIGTTDVPYEGDPRDAVASQQEIDYLIESVNSIVPSAKLTINDVEMHYSGVRPLPTTSGRTAASITRRHWLEQHDGEVVPTYSVIGGKLTTCRSLAEEATAKVLADLGRSVVADSQERPLPGGEQYPASDASLRKAQADIASTHRIPLETVEATWAWYGNQTATVLASIDQPLDDKLAGTVIPRNLARWIIEREWVQTLEDLVERRLMLLFDADLSVDCLRQLAQLLVDTGRLEADSLETAVDRTIQRLSRHFGKHVHGTVTSRQKGMSV